MIVCHKYKFIFIKTVKTGSTSVEIDLNKFLGENDIATPIFPIEGNHTPRNYEDRRSGLKLYNHMSAAEVKLYLGDAIFQNYFVFCVEREPVDKCISHYSMLKNSLDHNHNLDNLDFDAYINKKKFPIDTNKYVDLCGNLLVNKILKYENLAEELKEIGKIIGIDLFLTTRAKTGFRENFFVSLKQKEIIYEAFRQSLSYTNYILNSH